MNIFPDVAENIYSQIVYTVSVHVCFSVIGMRQERRKLASGQLILITSAEIAFTLRPLTSSQKRCIELLYKHKYKKEDIAFP